MVEYFFAVHSTTLLDKGYLVADAKLDKLADVQMCLGKRLKIDIVEDAILDAKADIVEGLVNTNLGRFIEQRTGATAIDGVVVVVEVAHGVKEVDTPSTIAVKLPNLNSLLSDKPPRIRFQRSVVVIYIPLFVNGLPMASL